MVPLDSHRVTRARATQDTTKNNNYYLYGTITLFGSSFQKILIHVTFYIVVLQPQYCRNNIGLG